MNLVRIRYLAKDWWECHPAAWYWWHFMPFRHKLLGRMKCSWCGDRISIFQTEVENYYASESEGHKKDIWFHRDCYVYWSLNNLAHHVALMHPDIPPKKEEYGDKYCGWSQCSYQDFILAGKSHKKARSGSFLISGEQMWKMLRHKRHKKRVVKK